jgi:hypothetical protein
MFFKKKKPFVRFVNAMPGVEISHPVLRATDYKFDWVRSAAMDYKERKSNYQMDDFLIGLNRCPGISHYLQTGFIITAPIDFTSATDSAKPDLFEWTCPVNFEFEGREYIGSHSSDQLAKFVPFRSDTLKTIIKVNTRWMIQSSSDIIFLQLPIAYPDHSTFTAAHGIIDCQKLLEINVQLFWHKKDGIALIKAGTPLCHIVPIPREFVVDLVVEARTEKDRYISAAYEYLAKKEFNKDMKLFFNSAKKLLSK